MKSSEGFKRFLVIFFGIVLAGMVCLGGVATGLFFGWTVYPVQWVDMAPGSLADEFQMEYMQMAIDSFNVNKDCALALQRYQTLGEAGQYILKDILENPAGQNPDSISAFSKCITK